MTWFQRLRCRHLWVWFRNIHGAERYYAGWRRSVWHCLFCGRWQDRPELHRPTEVDAALSDRVSEQLRAKFWKQVEK